VFTLIAAEIHVLLSNIGLCIIFSLQSRIDFQHCKFVVVEISNTVLKHTRVIHEHRYVYVSKKKYVISVLHQKAKRTKIVVATLLLVHRLVTRCTISLARPMQLSHGE
jgi:hypothetical protein